MPAGLLNHAANSDELTAACQQRFLTVIAPGAAEAIRRALAGTDGLRRHFLARQTVLRATRIVLVPPEPPAAGPNPVLTADLQGIDPESAAVLLARLAADSLTRERSTGEPESCGTTEPLAMEMIANNLFNDRDDNGDLLGRYRLLWMHYGTRLKRFPPRRPPAEMLLEATGISFDELTTLGFAYWTRVPAHRHRPEMRPPDRAEHCIRSATIDRCRSSHLPGIPGSSLTFRRPSAAEPASWLSPPAGKSSRSEPRGGCAPGRTT